MRAALTFALLAVTTPDFQVSGNALEFAPDIISTNYSDIRLTISPDGNTALWFSRNRPGGPGSYDIWISRRTSKGWSAAAPVPFNSPSRDFDPAFSRDGRFVYFSSDRPGGHGGDDIYRVAVTSKGFGTPASLGDAVNSSGNEWAPMVFGRTLLFSSNGHGGAGRMDLFTAVERRSRFGTPKPLPGLLNTSADEFDATFLRDGVSVIFTRAEDLAKDPVALYYGARIDGLYTRGNRLFDEINTPNSDTYAPMLDWSDPNYITFTTRRPADSARGPDLYRVEARVPVP
jgi:TolB protein